MDDNRLRRQGGELPTAMFGSLWPPFVRLFDALFGHMRYPESGAETVRRAAEEGAVVYVVRGASMLRLAYFNYIFLRAQLPVAAVVAGMGTFLWRPWSWFRWMFQRRHTRARGHWEHRFQDRLPTRAEAALGRAAAAGYTSLLFLPPPKRPGRPGGEMQHEFLRAVVAVQRSSGRTITVVPHVLTDAEASGATRRSLTDVLFGDRRNPGPIRLLVMMFEGAHLRVGDPISVGEHVMAHAEEPDALIARRLHRRLNRGMDEEERVVAGPDLAQYQTVERHVLRNAGLRAAMDAELSRGKGDRRQLTRRSRAFLREIAARYDVRYIRFVAGTLAWIFDRIYDGIVVDELGLRRVVEASRRGPVVFCPSHKSHMDYLVLSVVLWGYGLTPPHIAAGRNLSFFPMGKIFRSCGAFFMRRSFRGDQLYAAVFKAYVYEIISRGTSIEFFLEGTRSRTGKVLMPKLGLLGMVTDAWRSGAREDVIFIPVAIDYERIIEAPSYQRELRGGRKRTEGLTGLLRQTTVLRSRYGRVHLQFGTPLSLAEMATHRSLPRIAPSEASAEVNRAWREETRRLGYRLLRRVATSCSVTPTCLVATALLCHRGRGMARTEVGHRVDAIVEYLDAMAARFSVVLQARDRRPAAIDEALARLKDNGVLTVERAGESDDEPIFRCPEDRRSELSFYMNAAMNHFAPGAIAARCILVEGDNLCRESLENETRFLAGLFKREFIYRVDTTFESHLQDTLVALGLAGVIDLHEGGSLTVKRPDVLNLIASTLDSFIEAYATVAATLRVLRSFPLWAKELEERCLDACRRAYLEGRNQCPEAANKTLIASAVGAMLDAGVIEHSDDGQEGLQLTAEFAGSALDDLVADIERYRH